MTAQVKIKLLENGIMPTKGSEESAAWDIYLPYPVTLKNGSAFFVSLGFAMEIPKGHAAFIYPRSGLGGKGVGIKNAVGVIDSDYRGEIGAMLTYNAKDRTHICLSEGDRILQMVIQKLPEVELVEVDELSETKRGHGGFGSTGA